MLQEEEEKEHFVVRKFEIGEDSPYMVPVSEISHIENPNVN